MFSEFRKIPVTYLRKNFCSQLHLRGFCEFRIPCHLWEENRFHLTSNFWAIFPLNSLKNQQQMDNAEILHFNFDTYKILMQKFCGAILLLNSLKNQQQMDNAEILHSTLRNTKSVCKVLQSYTLLKSLYKQHITKLVSKCARGINEQLLKTSVADVRSGKISKNPQRVGQPAPPSPPARSYTSKG